ncbi:MAG: hypothetical protein K0R14_149 [Burkholderiales bacterium]|nr:hypothetical protein [Burkholderiales bacterium]
MKKLTVASAVFTLYVGFAQAIHIQCPDVPEKYDVKTPLEGKDGFKWMVDAERFGIDNSPLEIPLVKWPEHAVGVVGKDKVPFEDKYLYQTNSIGSPQCVYRYGNGRSAVYLTLKKAAYDWYVCSKVIYKLPSGSVDCATNSFELEPKNNRLIN